MNKQFNFLKFQATTFNEPINHFTESGLPKVHLFYSKLHRNGYRKGYRYGEETDTANFQKNWIRYEGETAVHTHTHSKIPSDIHNLDYHSLNRFRGSQTFILQIKTTEDPYIFRRNDCSCKLNIIHRQTSMAYLL